MRTEVVVTGDRSWFNPETSNVIVKRLLAKFGPDLRITVGASKYGIDGSIKRACTLQGVKTKRVPGSWAKPVVPEWEAVLGLSGDRENVLGEGVPALVVIVRPRSSRPLREDNERPAMMDSIHLATLAINSGIDCVLVDERCNPKPLTIADFYDDREGKTESIGTMDTDTDR